MPRVINVDKSPTFPPALQECQNDGLFIEDVQLRPIKYLNNAMENDHKVTKMKSRYCSWYQSFSTATCAIDLIESMRLIQKGQMKNCRSGDVCAQNKLINELFGLAA